MARTRRSRPGLTESWDDVGEQDFDSEIYAPGDEREELGESYASERQRGSGSQVSFDDEDGGAFVSSEAARNALHNSGTLDNDIKPRKRNTRSGDPKLVMPASPDGARKRASISRAKTPHSRLNQRSLTSDAGSFMRRTGGTTSSRTKKEEYDDEIDDTSDLNWPFMIWQNAVVPILWYAWDILRIAATNPFTKSLLAIWLVVGAVMLAGNFVNNTVTLALSPLCRIPGSSLLNLPFCPSGSTPELSGPAEFDKLVEAQTHFEDVLAASASGAFLSIEMKSSEAGIRDLKHVVAYSNLPSRNELVHEFEGFVDTARIASNDLSKFNSRIGRALDHILSTNRWTLQVIDGVASEDAARGSLNKWISKNFNIFAPFQPVALSQNVLLDQYLRHTSAVEEQILTLINEAHILLNVLDNLDGRLDVIASIAARDGVKVENGREQLLSQLWTKLGGSRNSMAKLDKQLSLLNNVSQYRRMAWAHVNGAVIKLMAIRDNLEDLRERVAMPETLGDVVPLEVHIENINLGIERLEQQRDSGRQVAQEQIAMLSSRAEAEARTMRIGEK